MPESLPRTKWRLKTIIAGLLMSTLGLGSLLWSIYGRHGTAAESVLRELATVLLVGGVLSLVFEFLQRRDFMLALDENADALRTSMRDHHTVVLEETRQHHAAVLGLVKLARQAESMGLVEARSEGGFDYRELLIRSGELVIALNDGRTWVSTNAAYLKQRFREENKTTTVYLVHPRSSLVDVLARKEGIDRNGFLHKLAETVLMLNQLREQGTQLEILGHHLFNPHSVFLGDQYVVLTPYFHSRGRRIVPAYKFENREGDSFYKEIKNDLLALRMDAEDIGAFASAQLGAHAPSVLADATATIVAPGATLQTP